MIRAERLTYDKTGVLPAYAGMILLRYWAS